MAKKKRKKDNESESIANLLSGVMGTIDKEDNAYDCGGVELKSFSERWLLDSNVIRTGEIYQFGGESAGGKSQYMDIISAAFVRAGGVAEKIDTEHKTNPTASVIPNIGEDIYYSGRYFYATAGSIDAAKAAKRGDEDAKEEKDKSWMSMVTNRINTIKASPVLSAIPIFIGVDSLLGAPSTESRSKFEDNGGSVNGRTATAMSRAAAITEYLPNIATAIAGTNITIGFTNHGKKPINVGGAKVYGTPKPNLPGGDGLLFHCSTVLYFKSGGAIHRKNVGGRKVNISIYKNSFGDDQRRLEVAFYYDILKDKEGNVVRDKFGYPMRRLLWDWDGATADLIFKYCGGSSSSNKNYISAVRDVFPGITKSGSTISCKKYGIDKMPFTEFGRHIMEDEDIYQQLMEVPKLSYHHVNPSKVIVPDWSDEDNLSKESGGWEEEGNLATDDMDAVLGKELSYDDDE